MTGTDASRPAPNADQAEFWNVHGGERWLRNHRHLEASMIHVAERVIEVSGLAPGERVLEIGCGAGGMALDLARLVGPDGHVTALDISETLLAEARRRGAGLANLEFVLTDAQTHRLDGSYDLVISRFGVMFFDDPVTAFRNIRTALRPGGRLAMICWASLADNPWFRIPAEAAIARFGPPEKPDPHAPGPLAFADAERVEGILRDAGFVDVRATVADIPLVPEGDCATVVRLATEIGPAARMLDDNDGTEEDRRAIEEVIAGAYAGFERDGRVVVPSVQNLFVATAP